MSKIVYTSENGTPYTKKDIMDAIEWYMSYPESGVFHRITDDDRERVKETLYDYIKNVIEWEHPETVLDQIDDDDVEVILSRCGLSEKYLLPDDGDVNDQLEK